jgi:azurin
MLRNFLLLVSLVLTSNLYAACSLEVSSSDILKFNKGKLTIDSSCAKFTINFKHDGEMAAKTFGHNIVIVEKKNFNKVKSNINKKLGENSGYLPEMSEIVAKTAIIGGGSQTSVTIDARKLSKDKQYMFFCGFPGHYGGMKGTVEVI